MRRAVALDDLAVLGLDLIDEALALGFHQNLDAGLVDVVAPPEAVVDPHNGVQVVQDLVRRQEFPNWGGQHRRAAHAATHQHPKTQPCRARVGLRVRRPDQVQAHVMPERGGTVVERAGHRNLELARQKSELGLQRAPLAQDFAIGARVGDLVDCNAGALVAGDVAYAVAAGLDAVHVHAGQQVHHVGAVFQADPVELHVLAGGEVAIAAGDSTGHGLGKFQPAGRQRFGPRGVMVTGDFGEHPQLGRRQLAIGHRHPQHRRVALHIPAVLQAQRLELVVRQLASLPASQLVAVLAGAGFDEGFIEGGVRIHGCAGPENVGNWVAGRVAVRIAVGIAVPVEARVGRSPRLSDPVAGHSDGDQLHAGAGQQHGQKGSDQPLRGLIDQLRAQPDAG